MVVDSGVLGELEQPLAKLGERLAVMLTFALELAQQIDDWVCCVGGLGPEVEGQLAADEIEVEVDESLLALAGEVEGDAVGAREAGRHVLDDSAIFVLTFFAQASLGLTLLEGLGVGLVVGVSHKFASPSAV